MTSPPLRPRTGAVPSRGREGTKGDGRGEHRSGDRCHGGRREGAGRRGSGDPCGRGAVATGGQGEGAALALERGPASPRGRGSTGPSIGRAGGTWA